MINRSLTINPEEVEKKIILFIRNKIHKAGFTRVVIGLSGGLDSTVSATLAVKALGKDSVFGFILPYRSVSKETLLDAESVGKDLGIYYTTVDITPIVDAYISSDDPQMYLRKGNLMARIRMAILYDQSVVFKALVLGTSNKTELLLGYGTIYGDLGVALQPLGGLYKTQVFQLAKYLNVKDSIINKKPTAELYPGQTDEGDLGATYADMDKILFHIHDLKLSNTRLRELGLDVNLAKRLRNLIKKNAFKGKLPPIAKLIS